LILINFIILIYNLKLLHKHKLYINVTIKETSNHNLFLYIHFYIFIVKKLKFFYNYIIYYEFMLLYKKFKTKLLKNEEWWSFLKNISIFSIKRFKTIKKYLLLLKNKNINQNLLFNRLSIRSKWNISKLRKLKYYICFKVFDIC